MMSLSYGSFCNFVADGVSTKISYESHVGAEKKNIIPLP